MSETPVALVIDKIDNVFIAAEFEVKVDSKTAPIISSTAKVSLISDVRPSKANIVPPSESLSQPLEQSPALA